MDGILFMFLKNNLKKSKNLLVRQSKDGVQIWSNLWSMVQDGSKEQSSQLSVSILTYFANVQKMFSHNAHYQICHEDNIDKMIFVD